MPPGAVCQEPSIRVEGLRCLRPAICLSPSTKAPVCHTHYMREYRRLQKGSEGQG
jgi:hypothetical protein